MSLIMAILIRLCLIAMIRQSLIKTESYHGHLRVVLSAAVAPREHVKQTSGGLKLLSAACHPRLPSMPQ